MTLLEPGDMFPTLPIHTTDGEELHLPDALAGQFRRRVVQPRILVPLLHRAAAGLPTGAGPLRGSRP